MLGTPMHAWFSPWHVRLQAYLAARGVKQPKSVYGRLKRGEDVELADGVVRYPGWYSSVQTLYISSHRTLGRFTNQNSPQKNTKKTAQPLPNSS